MIEVKHEIEISKPLDYLISYFMDPKNIMKYIPYFKEIHQIDENKFKVKIKWLFSLDFNVIRIYNKINNEIIYLISREGNIKINGQLIHILYKIGESRSKVLIRFVYEGLLESIVKRQAMKFLSNLSTRVFEEIIEVKKLESNSQFKIARQGIIEKEKLEDLIDFAMVESVNSSLQLILSDGENIIKMTFENGELKETIGNIDSLKNNIKYVIKMKKLA